MSIEMTPLMLNLNDSSQTPAHRHCKIGMLCLLLAHMGSPHAQEATAPKTVEAGTQVPLMPATGATTQFNISAFDIKGDNPLSAEESARILARFVVPNATLVTLQKATATYEEALKARGYPLHRVSLPPQNLGGKVTLIIVKFVIGKVTVQGNSYFTTDNIVASVPELKAGTAPVTV